MKAGAAALFQKKPQDAGNAFIAAIIKAGAVDQVEIWPENWRAFSLFLSLRTQWRVGMGGAIGLDYNVLFKKMDRMGLDGDEYDEIEQDVRTMELAALAAMKDGDE